MEPGLRDREYWRTLSRGASDGQKLQWSPVLETGNTRSHQPYGTPPGPAAMEPGLRDREYGRGLAVIGQEITAAMEPGLRDREYEEKMATGQIVNMLQWSPVLETGNTRP